jgi:hypothetical protein
MPGNILPRHRHLQMTQPVLLHSLGCGVGGNEKGGYEPICSSGEPLKAVAYTKETFCATTAHDSRGVDSHLQHPDGVEAWACRIHSKGPAWHCGRKTTRCCREETGLGAVEGRCRVGSHLRQPDGVGASWPYYTTVMIHILGLVSLAERIT